MIHWARLYRRISASVTKALAMLPFLGPLADFYTSLAKSISETGERIHGYGSNYKVKITPKLIAEHYQITSSLG